MSHQPSLPGTGLRVAFVTMHTSPLERAGTADAGGMNVLIAALARALGRLGVRVDFLTRRTDPDQPEQEEVERWSSSTVTPPRTSSSRTRPVGLCG